MFVLDNEHGAVWSFWSITPIQTHATPTFCANQPTTGYVPNVSNLCVRLGIEAETGS
jgi:hypothetical protein